MCPFNRPTVTLNFLLIAWSSFVLLGRDSLIRVVDWPQLLEVLHLFRCYCLKCFLVTSLPTTKGMPTVWSVGTSLILSLANLSASSLPGIPCCPGVRTKMSFLDLRRSKLPQNVGNYFTYQYGVRFQTTSLSSTLLWESQMWQFVAFF